MMKKLYLSIVGMLLINSSLAQTPQFVTPTKVNALKGLVVHIQAGSQIGAGLVFARDGNTLWIATANHLVRRGIQDTEEISVRFWEQPMKKLPAQLQKQADTDIDLAVIAVANLASEGIAPCDRGFHRLGDVSSLGRGDLVFPVGHPNGEPWAIPLEPDRIAVVEPDRLKFQSMFIAPGNSGGALVNADFELLGMITGDQPPFGIAKPISKVIERLIEWGFPVHLWQQVPGHLSALQSAARSGDLPVVKQQIADCGRLALEDYDRANSYGWAKSPLDLAAREGHLSVIRLLLEAGEIIDRHALELAVEGGHTAVAEELLEAGARVTEGALEAAFHDLSLFDRLVQETQELSPWLLERAESEAVVNRLLTAGLVPPPDALLDAMVKEHWGKVRALLQYGVDPNRTDDKGRTALHIAAEKGELSVARLVVKHGGDPDRSAEYYGYPYEVALGQELALGNRGKYLTLVHYLLSVKNKPSKIDTSTTMFWTPCGSARFDVLELLWDGHRAPAEWFNCVKHMLDQTRHLEAALDTARLFLENGADVNTVQKSRVTPLIEAFRLEQPDLAILLTSAGADVETRDTYNKWHRRPLHLAADLGWAEVVKALLTSGAQIEPTDERNCTPLALAASAGHLDVTTILLEHGANPTVINADITLVDCQPLERAIQGGHMPVVKQLLKAGADPTTRYNRSAIEAAIREGNEELARLLGINSSDIPARPERPRPVNVDELHIPSW